MDKCSGQMAISSSIVLPDEARIVLEYVLFPDSNSKSQDGTYIRLIRLAATSLSLGVTFILCFSYSPRVTLTS